MNSPLESCIDRARLGDADALETIVRTLKDDVYGLAMRMLWHPEDAEDATQEILFKVIMHLGSFRGESAFSTWAFRIACNHLLTTRKKRAERENLTFEVFAEQLAQGLVPADKSLLPDQGILVEEIKVGCTHAMLLFLDRSHRLAYVLGDVFALCGDDAANILEIKPATFRKQLSRARKAIRQFMVDHCGIISPERPCRCHRRIKPALQTGRVDPSRLLFAGAPTASPERSLLRRRVDEMESLHEAAALFRSHPCYRATDQIVDRVRRLIETDAYGILAT